MSYYYFHPSQTKESVYDLVFISFVRYSMQFFWSKASMGQSR